MALADLTLEFSNTNVHVNFCRLQKEVNEIRESVRLLKEKLRQAETSLARLRKTKATLEHDIGVKENSLMLDSKYCMGMRKNMPMDPKIGPIMQMPLICY